jgi:hypothetical protein
LIYFSLDFSDFQHFLFAEGNSCQELIPDQAINGIPLVAGFPLSTIVSRFVSISAPPDGGIAKFQLSLF